MKILQQQKTNEQITQSNCFKPVKSLSMEKRIFDIILSNRNLSTHDGRPLWKYRLTEGEFGQLRLHLMQTQWLYEIDPRDCALYYAEWWKRNYNGGSPSKW